MSGFDSLKSHLKDYKLVRDVYALVKQNNPAFRYRIPEIEIINHRPASAAVPVRLNLLVPSLEEKHVFGGIATALRFFEALRKCCDCPARIIITDSAFSGKSTKTPADYLEVDAETDSDARLQIIPFANRKNRSIPVGEGDLFLATGWWTAYAIQNTIRWQKTYFRRDNPLLYFIQDFEPCFYPWSSRYLLAESTYRFEFPTYAIVNSAYLKDYLCNQGFHFEKMWAFDPVLNPVLKTFLPAERTIPKKKQILVYGRPSTDRNAFSLIMYSLKEWANSYPEAGEWTVLSAGENFSSMNLGNGVTLKALGKLTLEEYADVLLSSYAGLSFMVSPHPSYPPLEMATFGVRTITNCFANKDLSSFSPDMISLNSSSPFEVSARLTELCSTYTGRAELHANDSYTNRADEFGTIPEEIAVLIHGRSKE